MKLGGFFIEMKNYSLLLSVLLIILGVVLIINPIEAAFLAARGIGLIILVTGIKLTMKNFKSNSAIGSYMLVLGIIIGLIGLAALIHPGIIVSFVIFIIGIIVLFRALMDFREAADGQRLGYSHWNIMLVMGIIKVIFAFMIIFAPFYAASVVFSLIGIILIIEGISNIITILKVSKDIKNLKDNDDIIDL